MPERMSNYFPGIKCLSPEEQTTSCGMSSYGIKVGFPEEYGKWISNINGNCGLRNMVEREIKNIFHHHIFNGQSFLRMLWKPDGISFETDGVNGCAVYVLYDGAYCHNVDNFEQFSILYISLSVYLTWLYRAMEILEREKEIPEEFAPLQKRMTTVIRLNKRESKQPKKYQTTLSNF